MRTLREEVLLTSENVLIYAVLTKIFYVEFDRLRQQKPRSRIDCCLLSHHSVGCAAS